ncbi:MAG TPA: hypothetical protein PLX39_15510 [Pyrinomonadaceae bacterium]|nr:hypothetical protein [Pyrinomonadaceae bacterium]
MSVSTKKPPASKPVAKPAAKAAKKRSSAPASRLKQAVPTEDLYSISALSRKFNLDRATVRDRINRNEIEPHSIKAKEKLYLLSDVENLLSQTGLTDAKFRKTHAEAELKTLELKKKSGEFASIAEFTEILQAMLSNFYTKTVVTLPTRISAKLHNANSSAQVGAILRDELNKEWKMLRENYPDYVNAGSKATSNRNPARNRSGSR